MIRLEDLPRDADGIVHGVWRVVHRSPTFHGQLGHLEFREGVATTPSFGVRLARLVASCGDELFLEQWTGPFPGDFALPEGMRAQLTEAELAKIVLAPWRQKIADVMEPLTLEVLRHAKMRGRDAESAVDDFAKMIRDVPECPPEEASNYRAMLIEARDTLLADEYVQIPKVLDGCITQLDAIIAKIPLEPLKQDAAPPTETSEAPASEAPTQTPAPIDALEAGPIPPVLEEPTQAEPAHEATIAPPVEPPTTQITPTETKSSAHQRPRRGSRS